MIRAAALLLLAGCATHAPTKPQPLVPTLAPAPSPVPVQIDVAAIKKLLQPCPIEPVKKYTADEPTRLANARLDALIQCNKDKAAALDKLEHQ